MKLAGITWWRNNYGSILQAYALQQALSEFDDVEYEIICQYGKKIASVDNLMDKLKNIGLRKSLKRIFWKFGLRKLRERNANIQNFVDANLKISEKQFSEENIAEANNDYDAFICGSDQIWNPTLVPVNSMYWLGFADDSKRKISYAPSFGVDSVTDEKADIIRKNLSGFKAISTREESGTKVINTVLGEEKCVTVLDPTLLVERTVWDDICTPRKISEPYVFAYMLRGTKNQRKLIEEFAKKKGLKLVTMPFLDTEKIVMYDFKFGDIKYWDASPADFISLIKYAEYVFADSFHCMVFSSIYHRPFFVFPKITNKKQADNAQISRMKNLQAIFGIDNRIINDDFSIEKLTQYEEIDWDNVDSKISENRVKSLEYLKYALGE